MLKYNPKYKFEPLKPNESYATLSTRDNKVVFDFILNPETLEWSYDTRYEQHNILNTAVPYQYYQNSSYVLKIPSVKFYTPGNSGDLTRALDTLKSFTIPIPGQAGTHTLRYTDGKTRLEFCKLKSFNFTEIQTRSGSVTMAEGSLVLLPMPEPAKDNRPLVRRLTERERSQQR